MIKDLIQRLQIDLEWAKANEWEAPICLADDLQTAIKYLSLTEQLKPFFEKFIKTI